MNKLEPFRKLEEAVQKKEEHARVLQIRFTLLKSLDSPLGIDLRTIDISFRADTVTDETVLAFLILCPNLEELKLSKMVELYAEGFLSTAPFRLFEKLPLKTLFLDHCFGRTDVIAWGQKQPNDRDLDALKLAPD